MSSVDTAALQMQTSATLCVRHITTFLFRTVLAALATIAVLRSIDGSQTTAAFASNVDASPIHHRRRQKEGVTSKLSLTPRHDHGVTGVWARLFLKDGTPIGQDHYLDDRHCFDVTNVAYFQLHCVDDWEDSYDTWAVVEHEGAGCDCQEKHILINKFDYCGPRQFWLSIGGPASNPILPRSLRFIDPDSLGLDKSCSHPPSPERLLRSAVFSLSVIYPSTIGFLSKTGNHVPSLYIPKDGQTQLTLL